MRPVRPTCRPQGTNHAECRNHVAACPRLLLHGGPPFRSRTLTSDAAHGQWRKRFRPVVLFLLSHSNVSFKACWAKRLRPMACRSLNKGYPLDGGPAAWAVSRCFSQAGALAPSQCRMRQAGCSLLWVACHLRLRFRVTPPLLPGPQATHAPQHPAKQCVPACMHQGMRSIVLAVILPPTGYLSC